MVNFQLILPEEYKREYDKFSILYGFYPTPFAKCLIGITDTDSAVLHLAFTNKKESDALSLLQADWPLSKLLEDKTKETLKIVNAVFSEESDTTDSLNVLLKGTEFQSKVWQSLISIPKGTTTTYEHIAQTIGNPKAIRAVGNAVAKNKIAYLIPCHRVMAKSGKNKYSWGPEIKTEILLYEKK